MSAIILYTVCFVHFFLVISEHTGLTGDEPGEEFSFPAKPSASQAKWQEMEVGAVIHFNMQTFNRFMKRGDVVPADTFNPRDLSTDQWVDAATSFGAKYVVLTLDHFSGFLLWPSATYNYTVKSTKWRDGKADIAYDFIESCRKKNVEYGYFYSMNKNWFMNVENFTTQTPDAQEHYNKIVLQQMRELFEANSKYANPFYIWFDAGTNVDVNPKIGPLIRSLAKDSICDECKTFSGHQGLQWVGNEKAVAPLPNWYAVPAGMCNNTLGVPRGVQFCPVSCDTVIRDHYWFWVPDTEHTIKTPQRLLQEYLTSVGRGCNLILNLNPDNRGLVPDKDLQVYRALGQGIKLLYKNLVMRITKPKLKTGQTYKWKIHETLKVSNGSLVLMEDIELNGQLVENYTISYYTSENLTVTEDGSTIGHKRIHPFPMMLRGNLLINIEIEITKLVEGDTIGLREIAVYDWSEAEKEGFF